MIKWCELRCARIQKNSPPYHPCHLIYDSNCKID